MSCVIDQRQRDGQQDALFDADQQNGHGGDQSNPEFRSSLGEDPAHPLQVDQLNADQEDNGLSTSFVG